MPDFYPLVTEPYYFIIFFCRAYWLVYFNISGARYKKEVYRLQ